MKRSTSQLGKCGDWKFAALEQFSELRDARNGTPPHSILRPAQCFALAPLAKKTLRLFVKCSRTPF
ncbi:hypothetical protein, partial [Deinococcus wulumuqiensis]|uniref:hypothetical protein n=1 Tax=Deinococcus wulumuqiensis TaxID=980427 RepID=UPI001CEF6A6A